MQPSKVVIIGNASVGKTALLGRFLNNSFSPTCPTVGGYSSSCSVEVNNQEIPLILWDTAGQDEFKDMMPLFMRDAVVALLVFDLTNRETFERLPEWLDFVARENADCNVVLAGNKSDLPPVVPRADVVALKNRNKLQYFETSAQNGNGVKEFFTAAGELVAQRKGLEVVEVKDAVGRILIFGGLQLIGEIGRILLIDRCSPFWMRRVERELLSFHKSIPPAHGDRESVDAHLGDGEGCKRILRGLFCHLSHSTLPRYNVVCAEMIGKGLLDCRTKRRFQWAHAFKWEPIWRLAVSSVV
jgi:small GTP-binding protein